MGIQVIKGGSISAYLKLAGDVALSASLISVVDQTNAVSGLQLATASIGLTMPTFLALPNWTVTLGIKDGFSSQQTVAVASLGTGVFRLIANKYTINNTGAQAGSVTGYFLNATETALGGITHNLMDLQKGGVSFFKINSDGSIINSGNIICNGGLELNATGVVNFKSRASIYSSADSIIKLSNGAQTDFNRLQLGGTTSSFPSIKRNGATIDFRLADDSAFCAVSTAALTTLGDVLLQTSNTAKFVSITSGTNKNIYQNFNAHELNVFYNSAYSTAVSIVGNGAALPTLNVFGKIVAASLPTTRPATVGEFYQDTAANILANGDKVVGIRQ